MPGFPVLHYLSELAQIHVHRVSDITQPSQSLSFSPPTFNLSQQTSIYTLYGFTFPEIPYKMNQTAHGLWSILIFFKEFMEMELDLEEMGQIIVLLVVSTINQSYCLYFSN